MDGHRCKPVSGTCFALDRTSGCNPTFAQRPRNIYASVHCMFRCSVAACSGKAHLNSASTYPRRPNPSRTIWRLPQLPPHALSHQRVPSCLWYWPMARACEMSPKTRVGWVSAAISVVRSRALRKAERNQAHSKQNDFNLSACRHDFQRIGLIVEYSRCNRGSERVYTQPESVTLRRSYNAI